MSKFLCIIVYIGIVLYLFAGFSESIKKSTADTNNDDKYKKQLKLTIFNDALNQKFLIVNGLCDFTLSQKRIFKLSCKVGGGYEEHHYILSSVMTIKSEPSNDLEYKVIQHED